MFDMVYDNGVQMLGKLSIVIEEIEKQIDANLDTPLVETTKLLQDLKYLRDTSKHHDIIVCVNYDNPMGYTIDYWTYDDIINKP